LSKVLLWFAVSGCFLIASYYVTDNFFLFWFVYSAAEQGTEFKPMLIEKWPLIQAFALDGFGG